MSRAFAGRSILAHCVPLSKMRFDSSRCGAHVCLSSANLKLASGYAPIPRLLNAGLRFLGADGASPAIIP